MSKHKENILLLLVLICVLGVFVATTIAKNNKIECLDEIKELKLQINDIEKLNTELEDKINTFKEEKEDNNKQDNTSRGAFPNRKYRKEKLIVTAYAPFDNKSGICTDGDPTKTATGTYPKHGTVAADPKRFPYGTKFYIEGYGHATCEDTGGAMRNNSNKIDIFMNTHDEAIQWGKREMEVIIFEN